MLSPVTVEGWQRRLYPDQAQQDPVRRFTHRVERMTRAEMRAVELGAGSGIINPHRVQARVGQLVGVDLSPRVGHNPVIDQGVVADVVTTPFPDASFDLAFATYVLEHIRQPAGFCRELHRILRPGGVFLALTPNRHHYVSLVSKVTPHRFHQWFNQTEARGGTEEDTFPTFYRLNSRGNLRHHLSEAGFTDVGFEMVEVQPNYLMWNTAAFLTGSAYERLVNSSEVFSSLRVNIVVTARA